MASNRKQARYLKRNEREVLNDKSKELEVKNEVLYNKGMALISENEELFKINEDLNLKVIDLINKIDKLNNDLDVLEKDLIDSEAERDIFLDDSNALAASLEAMIEANESMENAINELEDELDASNKSANITYIIFTIYIIVSLLIIYK